MIDYDDFQEEEDSSKVWKWEIWPHPYTNDYDYMVTDSDDEARDAILHAAEMHLWDTNDGEVRTLKVVHNAKGQRGAACGASPAPTGCAST